MGVNCDDDAFDTTLTFDATGALTSANSPITGIPAGTQCAVTETGTGTATATGYSVDGAGTFSASAPNVTDHDRRHERGRRPQLLPRLPRRHEGRQRHRRDRYDVHRGGQLRPIDAFDRTVTFGATGTLTSANSPITGIPAGTQCTVTETGKGGATTVAYKVGSGSPSAIPPHVTHRRRDPDP